MAPGLVYAFGPYELDAKAHWLSRNGVTVSVPARHLDVLLCLVARRGMVVSKDTLVEAGWRDVAVTDNSVEQAVSALRRLLGAEAQGEPYIQTVPRQGYRFVGEVRSRVERVEDIVLDGLVAPHRAWVEGRAALETLSADRIGGALTAFDGILRVTPDDPLAHIGMANACVMQYETTRADDVSDLDALARAARHAREACRLDPQSGEAWATHASPGRPSERPSASCSPASTRCRPGPRGRPRSFQGSVSSGCSA
jgi:DNA-binding winged helix-turn-helix (wHTH) protein